MNIETLIEAIEQLSGEDAARVEFRAQMVKHKRIMGIEPTPKAAEVVEAVSEVEAVVDEDLTKCPNCGKEFKAIRYNYGKQKYCSKGCKKEAEQPSLLTMQYSDKNLVIAELLKIANVTILPDGNFKFSGDTYSSKSNLGDLPKLLDCGDFGSQSRVISLNKYMKKYLKTEPTRCYVNRKEEGNRYKITFIPHDLLSDDDKVIIREMQANLKRRSKA